MANNDAHDTRTTFPANRAAQAVSLNVAARAAVVAGPNWPAEFDGVPVVFDGFESGTLSSPAINDVGFSWSETSSEIVTMDNGPLLIYRDGLVVSERPTDMTKSWQARSGNNAMLMNYPAGQNWVEQRFSTANPGMLGMWIAWDLRVPDNYYHNPQASASDENQKLLRLWTDAYAGSDGASKVGLSFRPLRDDGSSYYFGKIFGPATNGGDKGNVEFINVPRDLGKWMRLVVRVQFESSVGANDGSMTVWRKWEDQTDFTKDYDWQNQGIRTSNDADITGFAAGFLLGYANSAYTEDTDFLIDNFEIASLT